MDTVEKQQLKQTQSGEVAKADVIREYQQKRMQSGSISRSGCSQGAAAEVDTIRVQFGVTTQD